MGHTLIIIYRLREREKERKREREKERKREREKERKREREKDVENIVAKFSKK